MLHLAPHGLAKSFWQCREVFDPLADCMLSFFVAASAKGVVIASTATNKLILITGSSGLAVCRAGELLRLGFSARLDHRATRSLRKSKSRRVVCGRETIRASVRFLTDLPVRCQRGRLWIAQRSVDACRRARCKFESDHAAAKRHRNRFISQNTAVETFSG